MDEHLVQVDDKLNDNSSSDQGGKEISRSSPPPRETWSPEKPLVRFVTTLLILSGMSSGIRAIGLFWASTVLLPNLVNVPYGIDFYFIIIILLAEGARTFYLQYDHDWRLRSLWTVSDAVKSSCRIRWKCTWISKIQEHRGISSDDKATNPRCSDNNGPTTSGISSDEEDPLPLPDSSGHFLNKSLYCLQLLSASICITLSVVRFIQLSIGDDIDPSSGGYKPAAYVFYGLAFFQAFFSILEEVYWEWTITYRRLLEMVDKESHLGIVAIKSFCYHAHRECDKGNISDVLSFNLFLFASRMLDSHSRDEQLIGVQSLHKLSDDGRSSTDTLRKIGKSMVVIQRLMHMLSWTLSEDAEIRKAATGILVNLAGRSFNSFRLSGFPGALDNILDMMDAGNTVEDRRYGVTMVEKLSYGPIHCRDIANSKELIKRLKDRFRDDPALWDPIVTIAVNLFKNVGTSPFMEQVYENGYFRTVLKKLMVLEVNKELPPQMLVDLARMLICANSYYCYETIDQAGEGVPAVEFLGTNHEGGIEKLTIKLVQILQECHKLAILELPNGMTTPEQQDKVRETTASTIGLAIATISRCQDCLPEFQKDCKDRAVKRMRGLGMEDELRRIRDANTSILGCDKIRIRIDCALKLLAGETVSYSDINSLIMYDIADLKSSRSLP